MSAPIPRRQRPERLNTPLVMMLLCLLSFWALVVKACVL